MSWITDHNPKQQSSVLVPNGDPKAWVVSMGTIAKRNNSVNASWKVLLQYVPEPVQDTEDKNVSTTQSLPFIHSPVFQYLEMPTQCIIILYTYIYIFQVYKEWCCN